MNEKIEYRQADEPVVVEEISLKKIKRKEYERGFGHGTIASLLVFLVIGTANYFGWWPFG